VLSAGSNKSVKLWDLNGTCLHTFSGHSASVNCIALAPFQRFLTGSNDNSIKLWDLTMPTPNRLLRSYGLPTPGSHTRCITCLAVAPDGRFFVSGSLDKTLKLWSFEKSAALRTYDHTNVVNGVVVDGDRMLSSSLFDGVRVWNIESGEQLQMLQFDQECGITSIVLSVGLLVTSSANGSIRIFDSDYRMVRVFNYRNHVSCVTLSPDGKRLFCCSDRFVGVFDTASSNQVAELHGHSNDLFSIAVSGNGAFAISGGDDNSVRLWNITDMHAVHTFRASQESSAVYALSFWTETPVPKTRRPFVELSN
jgi:WD40 repeat protein